jgi:hypothetical protein
VNIEQAVAVARKRFAKEVETNLAYSFDRESQRELVVALLCSAFVDGFGAGFERAHEMLRETVRV